MTPDPREAQRHPTRTLVVLAGAALAYALAQTMVVPALPDIQRTYGVGAADATWLLTIFLLTSSVTTPLLGRLGDMYGKERLLLIALGVFGAGNLVAALGGSLGVLIAGRAIQGLGGAIIPLAIGIVRDEFPREKVATGIGTISAMFGIGGGAGLVIAGVLVDHASLAWIFWLSLAGSILAAWGTWRWVPESPVRVRARIDWGGATLLGLSLGALLLGVSQGNAWGWTSAGVLGLFAGAVALGVAFIAFEDRTEDPLVDLALMRRRPVWTTNLVGFAVGFAMFGSFILIPELVQTPSVAGYGFGATVTASGLFLLPSSVVMFFAGPLSGRLGASHGSKLPLLLGTIAAAASYFWLAFEHGSKLGIYVGSTLLGLGIGLAFAAIANLIVVAVPQDQTGVATAINTIARSVGGAVGAQVAAALVTAGTVTVGAVTYPAESGYTAAFVMSGVGALVALLATLAVPGDLRRDRTRQPVATGVPREGALVDERRRPPDAGDQGRRDRRRRRGDHVDPRHDDRQRRARDAVARAARRPVHDPVGLDGYLLALATVIPLTGWAAERFGPKRVWMTVVSGFVVSSALCGLAWSAESLIAFRVLQGLAGGMVMPIGMITLAQTAGPQRMGRVMSVVGVPMLLAPGPRAGHRRAHRRAPLLALDLLRQPPDRARRPRAGRPAAAERAGGGPGRDDEARLARPGAALARRGDARVRAQRGRLARQRVRPGTWRGWSAAWRSSRPSSVRGLRVERPLVDVRLFRGRGFSAAGGDDLHRRHGALRLDAPAAPVLPGRARRVAAARRPARRAPGPRRGVRACASAAG